SLSRSRTVPRGRYTIPDPTGDAPMLEVAEALAVVLEHARPLPPADAALGPAALGRVLAADVAADADSPPFAKSLRDGYAVRAAGAVRLPPRARDAGRRRGGAGRHRAHPRRPRGAGERRPDRGAARRPAAGRGARHRRRVGGPRGAAGAGADSQLERADARRP